MIRWMGIMAGLALSAPVIAQDCEVRSTAAELAEGLGKAETAYINVDEDGAVSAINVMTIHTLPCLSEPVAPDLAARYHRVMAIHLDYLGDGDSAQRSLVAAITLDSAYVFPNELLPPSHALRKSWELMRLNTPSASSRRVPLPREGSLAFDGTESRDRPATVPTIAQLLDAGGAVTQIHYLGPKAEMVPYAAIPKTRNALLIGGGAAAGAGGVLYAAAWFSRSATIKKADDPTATLGDLQAGQARTNALTITSAAIGAAIGALVVGER